MAVVEELINTLSEVEVTHLFLRCKTKNRIETGDMPENRQGTKMQCPMRPLKCHSKYFKSTYIPPDLQHNFHVVVTYKLKVGLSNTGLLSNGCVGHIRDHLLKKKLCNMLTMFAYGITYHKHIRIIIIWNVTARCYTAHNCAKNKTTSSISNTFPNSKFHTQNINSWVVVATLLKHMSQIGSPQVGPGKKNLGNQHPVFNSQET